MKSGDLTYILETEKHFLDIISDCYIGEAHFDSMTAIQEECMSRLRGKYTDSEIEELKNRLPKNFQPPAKSGKVMHEELLDFNRTVFLPMAIKVRIELVKHLSEGVKKNVKEIIASLKLDLDLHYKKLRTLIEKNKDISESNKLKELDRVKRKEELSNVIPSMAGVWRPDSSNYIQVREVAISLVEFFIPYEAELNKLLKKRYQIKLGRIGNFLNMGFSINKKEEVRIFSIMELLIIL